MATLRCRSTITLDGLFMLPNKRKALRAQAMAHVRVVQDLLRRWDPIGIEPGKIGPLDEYDSYATHIVSMVLSGCRTEQLAAYLERLGAETLGVGTSSERSYAQSLEIAESIVNSVRPST